MSTTTSEEIKLPKLDTSGKEWAVWKVQLQVVVASRGLSGYLNGTIPKPIDPAVGQPDGWTVKTVDEVKAVTEYTKDMTTWIEKDAKVQHIIATTLLNSLFIRLVNKKSAFEYFMMLSTLFEQCSIVVGAEMCRQLGELKLKEGGDARAHIDKIIASREELASIGRPVSNDDLFNIIYASLPHSYNPGLASLSSTMRLQNKTITPDDLIDIILEEYNRLTLQDGNKSKDKGSSEDAAFRADASRRGKRQKFLGSCHNCGWPGHKNGDCWEDGGGKARQAPKGWKP